jgi:ABC-2 type transport system permease protein
MNAVNETWVVFEHEMLRSVRSAKTLVLLILYSLATGVSGLIFVAATRKIQEQFLAATQGKEMPPEALMELKMGGLATVLGKDEALLRYLAQIPLVVVFFAWFAFFFVPLLSALMGFDQVSGELQSRSVRFVSLRARRGSLLAGKVLAQLALLLGLTAIINLGVFVYASLAVSGFPVGQGLLTMARFWLLTLVYASAYIGLVTLCSSLFRTPLFSLLTTLSVLLGFWMLGLLSHFAHLHFLAYVVPSHYQEGLFSPHPVTVLGSAGVYLAFAAVFLCLAGLTIRARDL